MDQFGGYELLERLGVGGMAEVWKARLTRAEGFEKTVVVKRILPHLARDPEFVRMFIAEAKLAATLIHANIVQVSDFGQVDGQPFLVMDFIDGLNLRQVQDAGPVSVAEAVLIASEVANALVVAGIHGVVHRDVSPQNILLSKHGEVKLSDFGIAKAADTSFGHTATGTLKGKVQYMAPEQLRGEPADIRSDIFALGVVLWELLAGRVLFSSPTELGILERRKAGLPPEPPSKFNPSVPRELDRVVLRCLEERPEQRFAKASELAAALDRAHQSEPGRPRAEILADLCKSRQDTSSRTTLMGPSPPTTRPARKPPRRFLAVFLALFAASAVVSLFAWSQLQVAEIRPPAVLEEPHQLELGPPPDGPAWKDFYTQSEIAIPPPPPSRPAVRNLPESRTASETKMKGLPASFFQPGTSNNPDAIDQPAAGESFGTVFLDSDPKAEVTQKDLSLGVTPLEKRLSPGEYTFVLGSVGNLAFVDVSIRSGEVLRIFYKLEDGRWIRVLNSRNVQAP